LLFVFSLGFGGPLLGILEAGFFKKLPAALLPWISLFFFCFWVGFWLSWIFMLTLGEVCLFLLSHTT